MSFNLHQEYFVGFALYVTTYSHSDSLDDANCHDISSLNEVAGFAMFHHQTLVMKLRHLPALLFIQL